MNTIIEIKQFGDFDILCTNCIMISSEKYDINSLNAEFCALNNINSFKGLSNEILRTITDDYIAFLELKGFNKLKTHEIYFCD